MTEKFSVSGMSCSACSAGIERAVGGLDGVYKVEVSLMGERMTVEYDEKRLKRQDIVACVEELGYGIGEFKEDVFEVKKPQPDKLKRRFLLSIFFLIPLMYFSMGGMVGFPQPNEKISVTVQMLLALAVVIIDFKFFTSGMKALIKKVPNMDTLVALGSGVSFLYSLALTIMLYMGTLSHAHFYYESAAMILALVTLGKWLEEKSKKKTGEEIEKLIRLMPNTVTVEREGLQSKISFSEIVKGDVLIVKQGEYIPVDGRIVEGHAFVDKSAITGESMPVELEVGAFVTGADIVKSGFIKVIAEKVGADTTLSQIVRMVKEAGASKAPLQKTADKIASVFVPIVTLLALCTFIVWFVVTGDIDRSANFAISVLVISCPCSLGLATPVAVMAATGKGMSLGILYKDAESLQKAKDISCVLLDKTATLTEGKPKVTEVILLKGEIERLLSIASGIESHSNHPLAECIKEYVAEKGIEFAKIEGYSYTMGEGAIGEYEGEKYYLGNRRLIKFLKADIGSELENQGKTVVFLANEKEVLAYFAIADTLKMESKEAIENLKAKNIRVAMLTGDNERVAKAIANEVGIEDYFAQALPKDKADAVKRTRELGGTVAMVGDGINDSPALKEADIGIAMGNGTDVAIDSADVVLSHGDLRLVATMVELSKKTVKNIKQNLFWAFFYNCVAIPVAMGAFAFANFTLNPMIGAACMSMSSLFVVTNALRLRNFKMDDKNNGEKVMKKTLKIEGMMCQHCVAHVSKALQAIEGVESVEVNLKKKSAEVLLNKEVSNNVFENAIKEAGYEIKKIS